MAFRRGMVLALALPILGAMALGCADDTTAPNTQDEAPVLAPTNVQAVVINGGDIRVSWDPSSQSGVRGYNVYRREIDEDVPARLNSSRVETTTFTDRTARVGHTYEYRVTAVGSKGTESRFTAVVIRNHAVIDEGRGGVPIPTEE